MQSKGSSSSSHRGSGGSILRKRKRQEEPGSEEEEDDDDNLSLAGGGGGGGYDTEDESDFIKLMAQIRRKKRLKRMKVEKRVHFQEEEEEAASSSSSSSSSSSDDTDGGDDDDDDSVSGGGQLRKPSRMELLLSYPLGLLVGNKGKFEERLKSLLPDKISPDILKKQISVMNGSPVHEFTVFVQYPDSLSLQELKLISTMRNVSWLKIDRHPDPQEKGQFCLKIVVCPNPDSAEKMKKAYLTAESYQVDKRMIKTQNQIMQSQLLQQQVTSSRRDLIQSSANYIESCISLDRTGGHHQGGGSLTSSTGLELVKEQQQQQGETALLVPPTTTTQQQKDKFFILFVQTPFTYSSLNRLKKFPLFSDIKICCFPKSNRVALRVELMDDSN